MKKIIFFITIFFGSFAFGQVQNGVKHEPSPNQKQFEVYNEVDKIAEFPDGINAFRQKVANNFRSKKINGYGKIRTEVTFIVERDGTINNVKAIGENEIFNKEAERAILKIKEKWRPAEINEFPVRYRFRLPLTMNFD